MTLFSLSKQPAKRKEKFKNHRTSKTLNIIEMNSSAWWNWTKLPIPINFSVDSSSPTFHLTKTILLHSVLLQEYSLYALYSLTTTIPLTQGTERNPSTSRSITAKTKLLLIQFFFKTCRHLRICNHQFSDKVCCVNLEFFHAWYFFPSWDVSFLKTGIVLYIYTHHGWQNTDS